jgi:hypothetical protein
MSFRPAARPCVLLAGLVLAVGLGACTPPARPSALQGMYRAWSGPGWYLERPYLIVAGGPQYLGGPWTYDKCEEERLRMPAESRSDLVCNRENQRPDRYGFF